MDAPVEFVKELLPTIVNIHTTIPRAHPSSRILGEERMGSGVVVDASGLLLTVNYVVMGANTIEVAPLKGRRSKAEVVAQDFEVGLALVRTKRPGLTPAPLDATKPPERGDPVIAIASTIRAHSAGSVQSSASPISSSSGRTTCSLTSE